MAAVKTAYGTTTTGTGGINSLASSATWVAGYEWFIIDNASELALDYLVELVVRVGTTPTINTEIRAYVFAVGDGGTQYPDVMDGTPSAETVTSAGVRDSFARLAAVGVVDSTTSDRDYPMAFNVAQFFGGSMPKKVGVFIAHNTGVNTNSTAGNQKYQYTPQWNTVA
jgi:hypothetical protein